MHTYITFTFATIKIKKNKNKNKKANPIILNNHHEEFSPNLFQKIYI